MTEKQALRQLEELYDSTIESTLAEIGKTVPLTKKKLIEQLMQANKLYWTARLAQLDEMYTAEAEQCAAVLSTAYTSAAETFSDRVRSIYANYNKTFGLSQKDADELMKSVRYDRTIAENLRAFADELPDGEEKDRILAEMSAPAYRYRMQRAEQLTAQAKETCNRIAENEIATDRVFMQTQTEKALNITAEGLSEETPADRVLDELNRRITQPDAPIQEFTPTTDKGVLDSFSLTSTENVREIVNSDWSGKSFSERIWDNTDDVAKSIKGVLIKGELTGASEADMAEQVANRFHVGMHEARRLVRTESNYCTNQAELRGYDAAGIEKYEYAALEDNRTSDICKALDGKVFKVADAVVGVNYPPMHPFCRSSTVPVIQTAEDIQREIDERIESWNIPEGMSLDEFVERVNNGELEQIREEQAEKEAEKALTSEDKSGIMELSDIQTGEHIKTDWYDQDVVYYDITDERINSIDDVQLSTLDEKANQKLTNECKSLLDYVRNDKAGTEAAFVFDCEINNRKEFKSPDANGHVNFICRANKSVVIHNHPDGLLFSEADLQRFEADEKIQILGAIGNNGSAYFVEKTNTYDHIGFYDFLGRSRGDYPINWTNEEQLKYSERILKESGNYGINVYIRQN